MARTPTTFDTFSAIAEPKRRQLLEALAGEAFTVSEITDKLSWAQPAVSKHLKVLKEVGLVSEQKRGRYRVYRVEAKQLKLVQDWAGQFARYWNKRLDQLETYLDTLQSEEDSP